jgi:hypothetical protein
MVCMTNILQASMAKVDCNNWHTSKHTSVSCTDPDQTHSLSIPGSSSRPFRPDGPPPGAAGAAAAAKKQISQLLACCRDGGLWCGLAAAHVDLLAPSAANAFESEDEGVRGSRFEASEVDDLRMDAILYQLASEDELGPTSGEVLVKQLRRATRWDRGDGG